MDEATWLKSRDLDAMLQFLLREGKLSERKARLIAVACCRQFWDLLSDARSRRAVEVAERHADGLASPREIAAAARAAYAATEKLGWPNTVQSQAAFAAFSLVPHPLPDGDDPLAVVIEAIHAARQALPRTRQRELCYLMRDIIGPLPFRAVTIAPGWLAWSGGTVVKLAQSIYNAGDYGRLAILADGLEESGCADFDLLTHCRAPGQHTKGCWLIDSLIGKS